ncbi:Fur family transcriptional regulator Irr [Bradyrhizobium roseum]|uniref:Fur family transcriptional regulator Irr n=1 Tax=Bradyrhizobium roseum TaxID=3056648 RepID=UPI00260D8E76|nr:Fur family transcriptional regulator [Bradyrhizobium roseus]WKA28537.1 Fur family transcriptional regulator [Bradyrhizobium roseus]
MDMTTKAPRIDNRPQPFVDAGRQVRPKPAMEASEHDCVGLFRGAGLRPTRQRMMLGAILFGKGGRHITAEMLHAEAVEADLQVSMATVYNNLKQLTGVGLLRQIGVDGSKSFFDTNPTTHHHFYVDHEDRLLDVPEPGVEIEQLPQPLPGYEISRVDVVVHLRRKQV